ncbi:PREDICTED: uncharacterized protein LOC101304584 [Fragaria vesca subsp. vesca]|uniref:uncharacterized protein LOC101304584 n=1 Tax=Fragaria vesca subsp. vesca TaxID=101020 RepID=UPI0002C33437|nr:PREDICTED: uncharacterized protein LOC101304584 [Fragaria vesca subsp. vesca]XP_011463962.1 PREDICTED: uncharacterized protein LOC101304584 [Fragaria vesca subsp. vesca]
MGIMARSNSTAEPDDDADTDTIPSMISKLKTAFLPAEYARAERALLARESNLKREIENLKKENAKLLEANQFRELEMLRVETESKGVILEQRRRIRELERQKLKLEGLVVSEYEGWKGLASKLEGDARRLSCEKGTSGGVVVKLEVEGDEIGGVASSVKDSGIRKFPSEDAGLNDRHYECAPKETEMLCEKSEIQKDTESLSLTGVERKPRVPKRKPASSLSGSDDDDKEGGKFKEDKNLNNEMKQRQKLSLVPDCPFINNHCTEKLDFSGIKVSENQNLPNYEQVNSRVSEEKIVAEQKSQLFLNAPMEVSSDSDSSSCSSSSSDSEDDNLSQLKLTIST